ncbi:hypothetical protein HPB50_022260 [Hyalomma asiaticum]|uniref:Uncharacterized protein n=1 Tax=Hyalomma asiaticum TaxID=266040 RepID=A0ACB7T6P9_HYAAI|nr:hypothetical protein HPB50_022260 [Hyalomma asiaticum]
MTVLEEPSLESLPNEILFKIFSLLDAQFVTDVIGKLCTRFALVLGDPSFWKAKLISRWPKPYPVSTGNTLHTSSFDSTFKSWDVECGLSALNSFLVRAPVTTICSSDGELVLGGCDGTIYRYDLREPGGPSPCYGPVRGVVTCMAADNETILAGTVTARLCAFDRRTRKLVPDMGIRFKQNNPSALSFDSRQLWVGMRNGTVHTVDMTCTPSKIIQTMEVPPSKARGMVSSIQHTLGSVLVSFVEVPMVALEPTLDPAVIAWGPEWQRVTRFHFDGRTLATVGSESLEVWHPKCTTGFL